MTEYEVADLAVSTQAIFWQQAQVAQDYLERIFDVLTQFGTLLFGYLIVAYFVGAQLTRVQVAILTAFYLFWIVRLGVVLNMVVVLSQFTLGEMKKISPDFDPALPSALGPFSLLFFLSLASLYFMWSVRHPKKK